MNKRIVILKWVFFGLMIIINAFIIYQSCLPEVSSKSWSDTVVEIIEVITHSDVQSSTPVTPNMTFGKLIRKIFGHFSLFAVDGAVTFFYFYFLDESTKHKYKYLLFFLSLVMGILLAVITESLQLIIPGRVGDIVDILIDIGGYLFGVGIPMLIVFLIYQHKKKKDLIKES